MGRSRQNKLADFDIGTMNAAIRQFSAWIKEDAAEVVIDEGRLLFTDAMHRTPPWDENKKRGSTSKDRKIGENAVERSIHNSFTPILTSKTELPELRKAFEARDIGAANHILRATGSKWRVRPFSADRHRRNRGTKGRVYRSKRTLTWPGQTRAYAAKSKRGVGTHKAAWGDMAERLGGHKKAKTKARIPKWVTKNRSRGKKLIRKDGGVPRISKRGAWIDYSVVSHPQLQFSMGRAIAARVRSLQLKVRKIVKGRANDVNTKFSIRKR